MTRAPASGVPLDVRTVPLRRLVGVWASAGITAHNRPAATTRADRGDLMRNIATSPGTGEMLAEGSRGDGTPHSRRRRRPAGWRARLLSALACMREYTSGRRDRQYSKQGCFLVASTEATSLS